MAEHIQISFSSACLPREMTRPATSQPALIQRRTNIATVRSRLTAKPRDTQHFKQRCGGFARTEQVAIFCSLCYAELYARHPTCNGTGHATRAGSPDKIVIESLQISVVQRHAIALSYLLPFKHAVFPGDNALLSSSSWMRSSGGFASFVKQFVLLAVTWADLELALSCVGWRFAAASGNPVRSR